MCPAIEDREDDPDEHGDDDQLDSEHPPRLSRNGQHDRHQQDEHEQAERLCATVTELDRAGDDLDPDRHGDEQQADQGAGGCAGDLGEAIPAGHDEPWATTQGGRSWGTKACRQPCATACHSAARLLGQPHGLERFADVEIDLQPRDAATARKVGDHGG